MHAYSPHELYCSWLLGGHRRCIELVLRGHHWSRSPPSWNNDFSAWLYRFSEPRMGGIQLGGWRKDVLVVLVRCHVSFYWVIRGVCHLCFGNRCQIDLCVADVHVWCFETRRHIWNRKWLPQEAFTVRVPQSWPLKDWWRDLIESRNTSSCWSLEDGHCCVLLTAIAVGRMMNWTLYKKMDELWELHWRRYMFIVFDLQEANVCEYVRKDAWNSYQNACNRCQGGSTRTLASASLASQSDLRVAGPVSDILFHTNKKDLWRCGTWILQ